MTDDHFQNSTYSAPSNPAGGHSPPSKNGCIAYTSLTPGKQQTWLQEQPPPKTKEAAQHQRQVKRLIRLSKDEENE